MTNPFMKIVLIVIVAMFVCKVSFAQNKIKLKKEVIIDTLSFSINYPSDFDHDRRSRYDSLLEVVVAKKNMSSSFYTAINSNETNYLKVDMEAVKYVGKKESLKSSGSNLLFFGGHVAMVSALGWTLPVLILFYPETKSGIKIKMDERLVTSADVIESEIGSNGYFSSIKTQDRRFEKKFQKTVNKLLKGINKQNVKNTKLKSRLDIRGDCAKT